MATSYKTPGVYVEEISSLPASVAQVETAIPAFIGYTEFHTDIDGSDLLNVPTRISSLVDFREKYGAAPPLDITSINLNGTYQVTGLDVASNYYMFDAIRMFYANGGGDCYIVAVGKYSDGTIQNGAADGSTNGFLTGLEALKKADEPTLLLAPDAVKMSQTNMDTLHAQMLSHAGRMQDRFCVFDLKENDGTHQDAVDNFRAGVGVNKLKYGAAYTPWVKANLPKDVKYKSLKGKILIGGSAISNLKAIADPNSLEAQFSADRLDTLVADEVKIDSVITALKSGEATLEDRFQNLYQTFANETNSGNKKTALTTLLNFYVETMRSYQTWVAGTGVGDVIGTYSGTYGALTTGKSYLGSELSTYLSTYYGPVATVLSSYLKEANTALSIAVTALPATAWTNTTLAAAYTASSASAIFGAGTNLEKMTRAASTVKAIWTNIKAGIEYAVATYDSLSSTVETSAKAQIPVLKGIVDKIGGSLTTMPPSGSIVGVYAATDRSRGVWKAPANVSLNSVAGVDTLISHEKQENLNVDVVAGKSINAIRPFTGKGIMVWGARTLAGNDNEWRYVPVRRLYLMVEESVKKATEFVVFEPNDKNTWVRMKGMISNFLTDLWRAGALAGAKPDKAFFVNVGLGETMTAQDILEGRMIVEIGMAAVRPAEFIILRFYHKLQEA